MADVVEEDSALMGAWRGGVATRLVFLAYVVLFILT
jgi:hypothetical protein